MRYDVGWRSRKQVAPGPGALVPGLRQCQFILGYAPNGHVSICDVHMLQAMWHTYQSGNSTGFSRTALLAVCLQFSWTSFDRNSTAESSRVVTPIAGPRTTLICPVWTYLPFTSSVSFHARFKKTLKFGSKKLHFHLMKLKFGLRSGTSIEKNKKFSIKRESSRNGAW